MGKLRASTAFALLIGLAIAATGASARPGRETARPVIRTVASGLGSLTYVTAPPSEPTRLYVVVRSGLVRVLVNGRVLKPAFLDIRSKVGTAGEGDAALHVAEEPSPIRSANAERRLVLRALHGDHVAFAELVRAHERIAYRAASLIAGPADADDATQTALVKAHRALGRFELGRPFRPWLLQIVVNEARTAWRAAHRQRAISARALGDHDGREWTSPGARVGRTETDAVLRAAIERLSSKYRDVVTCRYLLELSEDETARVLSIPAGTVKSRLSRALDQLRIELERAGVTANDGAAAA
jgi:RNA polymerase sigma-70 factor (ECF subfamily)